jgi:outer membrane protein OmpA-like peptidoglycan-associated protein/tetratricopeptide (TPR) repeat protein
MRELIFIILFVVPFQVFCQENTPFLRENFKSDEDYNTAIEALARGNSYFDQGDDFYQKAIDEYLIAYDLNTQNAELNYKLGVCILLAVPQKEKAVNYFHMAYALDSNVADDIHYVLAKGYHFTNRFDEAVAQYKLFYKGLGEDLKPRWKPMIEKWIQECKNGNDILSDTLQLRLENLGEDFNSIQSDHSPLISADNSTMIFTSQRPSDQSYQFAEGKYYEDIYISHFNDGKWSKPKNIGAPINTLNHDATVGISPDGQHLLVYRSSSGGGDIYECKLEGDKWSEPRALSGNVNTLYQETSACMSPDGSTLYFVSNRPGGNGGRDIYYSQKVKKGAWGPAVNMGPKINTSFDEEGVFMHADGRTLYFSSKGHKTLGGFDIFKTVKDSLGIWSEPVNVGYPINTPENDVFFFMGADGKHGYFSSFKKGGVGGQDIYKASFVTSDGETSKLNEEDARVTILKGAVSSTEDKSLIGADIIVYDNNRHEMVSTHNSNSLSGAYLVSLPSGKNYGVMYVADNKMFKTINFNIPDTSDYNEITLDIELEALKDSTVSVLNNISFDYAGFVLKSRSYQELDLLYWYLNKYPEIKVEIGAHTDNVGKKKNLEKLSQNRADAVKKYLIEKGVADDRIVAVGYADKHPVSEEDTDEAKEKNRRVELRIISVK